MVTYKDILFCTDFSNNAQAALPYAIDLAKKYGAALHLLHVYQEAGHIAEFELSSDTGTTNPGRPSGGHRNGEAPRGPLRRDR